MFHPLLRLIGRTSDFGVWVCFFCCFVVGFGVFVVCLCFVFFFDFAGLFVYANLFFRIAVAAVTGGAIGVIDT